MRAKEIGDVVVAMIKPGIGQPCLPLCKWGFGHRIKGLNIIGQRYWFSDARLALWARRKRDQWDINRADLSE